MSSGEETVQHEVGKSVDKKPIGRKVDCVEAALTDVKEQRKAVQGQFE